MIVFHLKLKDWKDGHHFQHHLCHDGHCLSGHSDEAPIFNHVIISCSTLQKSQKGRSTLSILNHLSFTLHCDVLCLLPVLEQHGTSKRCKEWKTSGFRILSLHRWPLISYSFLLRYQLSHSLVLDNPSSFHFELFPLLSYLFIHFLFFWQFTDAITSPRYDFSLLCYSQCSVVTPLLTGISGSLIRCVCVCVCIGSQCVMWKVQLQLQNQGLSRELRNGCQGFSISCLL